MHHDVLWGLVRARCLAHCDADERAHLRANDQRGADGIAGDVRAVSRADGRAHTGSDSRAHTGSTESPVPAPTASPIAEPTKQPTIDRPVGTP